MHRAPLWEAIRKEKYVAKSRNHTRRFPDCAPPHARYFAAARKPPAEPRIAAKLL